MSAVERVRSAYETLRRVDRPEVWISLRAEADVLSEAAAIDARVAAGARLPLAGLAAAVKDNIDVAGLATTAGTAAFAYSPEADAVAVARLRAAGAVVLGKTNLDQFATGLVGTRSPFGAVRNAWDPARISGGSSSGSAVAVALGVVDIALGTDTAGSGRVPAALNGVVGVKPTRALVPTTGVVPACRSLDCVTVFARDLALARLAAGIMAQDDDRDRAVLPAVPKVAIPAPEHLAGLAEGWAEAFAAAVGRVRDTGAEIVEVDITPLLEAANLLYGGAFVAERYAAVGGFIQDNRALIGGDLDPTVASIILAGASWSAAELFGDRERLEALAAAGLAALAGCDALLTPTTTAHPTLAEVAAEPVAVNARLGRFTNFANLLDLAALAVPAGEVHGLPFGVMFTGRAFSDRALAELAGRLLSPRVELAVFGAHLRGQPLNAQLVAAGGTFVADIRTAAEYRFYALATDPPKPGLVRVAGVAPGVAPAVVPEGASISGELWSLPAAGFATFVASLPQPMTIGRVSLSDGGTAPGFLCEPSAVVGAADITASGGWRAHLRDKTAAERMPVQEAHAG
ncbi:allophanate hydrolase [Catenulispora acidiphila DSM 44928]|uniref:Allophanate hydrolase n=1 Tax=Catenulispora acidiphila (strain DSM 44928 / JCM 14897 / NBRC 102108 / NRRL B-24433 / ID139908) TaxID=479433 RepID=C7QC12_CATAD|nr:allophanate hydrolase [Catenulispora acidiphila]ACU72631.1 allophanate hydrolase [Catenulispora acidiphila DSM 44928]